MRKHWEVINGQMVPPNPQKQAVRLARWEFKQALKDRALILFAVPAMMMALLSNQIVAPIIHAIVHFLTGGAI